MTNSLGGFFYYAIPLYQFYPKLLCMGADGKEYECARELACDSSEFRVNYNDPETFENWITELDLICSPKWMIGLIGTISFAGFIFGAFFIIPLADYYGRRKMLLVGGGLFYLACMLTHPAISQNIYMLFAMMFLAGTFALTRST